MLRANGMVGFDVSWGPRSLGGEWRVASWLAWWDVANGLSAHCASPTLGLVSGDSGRGEPGVPPYISPHHSGAQHAPPRFAQGMHRNGGTRQHCAGICTSMQSAHLAIQRLSVSVTYRRMCHEPLVGSARIRTVRTQSSPIRPTVQSTTTGPSNPLQSEPRDADPAQAGPQ